MTDEDKALRLLMDMQNGDHGAIQMLLDMQNDLLVVMQAAWIEWQHGAGADSAMVWISNALAGPGLIPQTSEPYAKEAQLFYDANQSDPMPRCECGKPSHIGWMGRGFCCQEHYAQAKAKSLN